MCTRSHYLSLFHVEMLYIFMTCLKYNINMQIRKENRNRATHTEKKNEKGAIKIQSGLSEEIEQKDKMEMREF